MKIAFLSSLDPLDHNSWSGTLFHIYSYLKKNNDVIWIGEELMVLVYQFHIENYGKEIPFVPERYAQIFGIYLSHNIIIKDCDLIICRDYFFGAYFRATIPFVYIGDTTFHLFRTYFNCVDQEFYKLAEELEFRTIQNADKLIYSSEWAAKSAIDHYNCSSDKIIVIEFGANIDGFTIPSQFNKKGEICNLLFIGKNWTKKGGDKVLKAFHILKKRGFHCTLTIVGSIPPVIGSIDPDLYIYNFIDKSTENGRQLLSDILCRSHFLILPTQFDCFGVVFCEASAFGIPSLASRVGGVSQVIRKGKNGYLLEPYATAVDYANKIETLFSNTNNYLRLRETSRKEYLNRLNWDIWEKKINNVLNVLLT